MKRGDQEDRADRHDGNALKDTERAWREAQHMLRVERVRHQCGAGEKPEAIRKAAIR
jgi:hypothetical protein